MRKFIFLDDLQSFRILSTLYMNPCFHVDIFAMYIIDPEILSQCKIVIQTHLQITCRVLHLLSLTLSLM